MFETQRVLLSLSEAFAKGLFAGKPILFYVTELHRIVEPFVCLGPAAELKAPHLVPDAPDRQTACENQADSDQRQEELAPRGHKRHRVNNL